MMQFVGNINSALSAYLSDWFCHAWDFITGQYELVLHSEGEYVNGYSKDDIEAMRRAGLTEEDIAEILGIDVAEDDSSVVQYTESRNTTQPTSDEKTSVSESVVIPSNPDEKTRVDYELTYYVNDVNTENTQVLMEYGKRDELKSVYTYGNERISAETIANTFNPKMDDFETDYYLYDGRGSVTQVLNSSEIVESYTYDPFGNVTSGAPDFDSFYGYNAEDTNPVTGLQYLRARYYDTEDGRFSVADTYLGDVSEPLTLNRYAYTANNPVMQTDPSGHAAKWLQKAVNSVKKAANWANENIVKPVVKVAKSAASWVNDNIIQPVKEKVTSNLSSAQDKLQKTSKKIQQGYKNIEEKATKVYRQTTEYIEKRTAEIKEKVIEFSCGTAEKLSNAWEATVEKASNVVNSVSEWCSNIQWDRVAQGAIKIIGGVVIVGVGAAAVVATGGLAAGAFAGLAVGAFTSANLVVAGTALAGAAAIGFGAADIVEGVQESSLGFAGDTETAAINPVRDTLFKDNPDNYYLLETLSTFGAAQGTQLINQNSAYYSSSVGKQSQSTPPATIGDSVQNNTNKADFYVTPSGEAIPSTGYRYMSRNPEVVLSAQNGTLPAKNDGMYFSFDKMDDAIVAQGKLQIPYRPEYRISFDTLDIIDDISIPNGQWGQANYLEPITQDYKCFGPGGATQAVTYSEINSVEQIFKLR